MKRFAVLVVLLPFFAGRPSARQAPAAATGDLDTFMLQVLARRDDNWKKLQQYILDERERAELRGPSGALVWGQTREYTWYVRDGYFVRSPVRFNGVAISETDRQKYEDNFLKRAKDRDGRGQSNNVGSASTDPAAPNDIQALITQAREPQFISSAYFLRFKFEPGHYGFVGHETVDNRDVLKIEYYPTRLFTNTPQTRIERRQSQVAKGSHENDERFGEEVQRLMNKVSLVTLWIEPGARQIVKYTFDNTGLDFLPLSALVRVAELKASMSMSEAFPGVWLPKKINTSGALVLAAGRFDIEYSVDYGGYREAKVSTSIRSGAVR